MAYGDVGWCGFGITDAAGLERSHEVFFFIIVIDLSISPVQLNNPKPLEKLAEIWSGFSQFWECIVVFLPISSVVYLCDWDARWLAVTDPKVISWISAVKQIGGLRPNRIKRDWPCARAVMKSGSTQTVAGQCIWGIIIQNSNALSEGNLEKDREERWDLALRCQVKRKILQLSILLLRILHVGALDLFSTVVTMNEFMGLHPPLLPDSPRDQRKVFSRWLIKVRGVACGWEDSATEFIISVPLIRSEFNSTHATKRGQGCGGNNSYGCISRFISMPLNDRGHEMAFLYVGLSLCQGLNNLWPERNPRMWLSALSRAQPTEMVMHSSAWRTPVSVWDCKTVSWSSRWNFSEGFSRVILILCFSSFGV